MINKPIYSLRIEEVYRALETSPEGLSSGEVRARRALYGENSLSEPASVPYWARFLAHTTHIMALLLWAAGVLAFLAQRPALGLAIWILILVNASFSFWREYRAEQAMAALRKLLPIYARVIRDGEEVRVPAGELVPGDLLVLAEGDNIPADARLVEEYGLRTNNATLTGEAVPSRKAADASLREGISEVEHPNLVFAGTSVVSGTGRAVIFATGMLTQFGRIARLTQAVKEEPSPLQSELIRITRIISLAAILVGGIVFMVGTMDVGLQKFDAFLLAIGIIVAAVPEGLPATITLSLAIAVQRLAQRQVLIKRLSSIETLGTVSMICTDKSGTLTQNQMTVREIWVAGIDLKVSGVGYDPQGEFYPNPNGKPFENDLISLFEAAMLCNNSRLNPPSSDHPHWTSLGDQTEVALRVVAGKAGLKEEELNRRYPRIHELPFDARRKCMTTIHKDLREAASGQQIAYVKGAPREILQLCTHILIKGELRPLGEDLRAQILAANDAYARNALRVLAFARRVLAPRTRTGAYTVDHIEHELTFLGLMAMMDPARPEVAEAVKTCRQAGIRMVMITGDYGLTAESLGRRIGMLTTPNPQILTGAELDELDEAGLQAILDQEVIFARMAPEHKLRLVSAFQSRGEVVAVTGDGVNDAPALRKADVGIAMGIIGTDVAKEAADVIITDDNFAAIVSAIEEGRAVYDNLRKFITYIFSSNVPEMLPFILTSLFDIPLALTVKQILAIDLGTDLLPALALGTEKPEPDVMQRPPRRRNQPLIDGHLLARAFLWLGLIEAGLCYIGFFFVLSAPRYLSWLPFPALQGLESAISHLSRPHANLLAITIFHAGVVVAQAGNAFACRTEVHRGRQLGWLSNRFLLAGVAIEIAIILALIYFPPLARLFDHQPIPILLWFGVILYAPILYALDWIRKSAMRKLKPFEGAVEVNELSTESH